MSSDKKKKTLKLPEECYKLSVNACTSEKVMNRCKIKRTTLGFKNRCVPNEDYETDKYLLTKGFKNFARIDENNLDKELKLRDELCKQLSAQPGGACESPKGVIIGCGIKKSFFGGKTCGLSPEIINYFYRKRDYCVARDCEENRRKYSLLCEEHHQELNELLQEYKNYYQNIVFKKKNIKDNLFYFDDIYDYLNEIYGVYLLEKPNIRKGLEDMQMDVNLQINQDQCQAYNVNTCNTNKEKQRCRLKGTELKEGIFCKTHLKCYDTRIKKFQYLRDNFEKICGNDSCGAQLGKLREFHSMIKFTTDGEAAKKKYEILETIEIIEEFSKI